MTALSTSGLVLSGVWSIALEVYPSRGNGFAAAIVGALVAMGLLIAVMVFISSKPRNRRRREP